MTDMHIRVHGYSLVQVEADEPWCDTIGLQESYGHPELVTHSLEMDAQVELIQAAARWSPRAMPTRATCDSTGSAWSRFTDGT